MKSAKIWKFSCLFTLCICIICTVIFTKYLHKKRDYYNARIAELNFYIKNIRKLPGSETKSSANMNNGEVLVINLTKHTNRMNAFAEQFNKEGIKYNRFNAVLGYDVKIIEENGTAHRGIDIKNGTFNFQPGKSYEIACKNHTFTHYVPLYRKRNVSIGEIGIYCSHYEIFNQVIEKNLKYAVVFEDDVVISKGFKDYLARITKALDSMKDVDILYLANAVGYIGEKYPNKTYAFGEALEDIKQYGSFETLPSEIKDVHFEKVNSDISKHLNLQNLNSKVQYDGSLYGYIVTNRGAKKLAKFLQIGSQAVDTQIAILHKNSEVSMHIANKAMVAPGSAESSYGVYNNIGENPGIAKKLDN